MDVRQLHAVPHRGITSWVLQSATRPAAWACNSQRKTRRSFSGSSGSCGNRTCFSSEGLSSRQATILRAQATSWSSARSDPPEVAPGKRLPVKPEADVPEAHKVFDEAVIVVKSGRGGNGEVVPAGRGRYVSNHKYKPGGSQSKQIWLPASDPGDGADGGDVVLVCDPGVDSLLHLHARAGGSKAGAGAGAGGRGGGGAGAGGGAAGAAAFCAPDGSNANPNTGSGGPKKNKDIKKAWTSALEIPVPPGTVVKRRGTGALLGELLQPGQRLTVARGGAGGHGVVAPSREQRRARMSRAERDARSKGVELVEVEDEGWRADSRGQPGQQLTLTLLLRVVADVGLVGFPNAGKSSLLKALTRASPTIAPYPFTTLMPNLGVLSAGGGATKAVLADLPGLIEGAHKGRGLGRNFLRHLRRTRALLHVVDASAPDPATDYFAVREELRMYNPDYCARPHVVALNKVDLLLQPQLPSPGDAAPAAATAASSEHPARQQKQQPLAAAALVSTIREAARRQAAEHAQHAYDGPKPRAPLVIVPCSAATGEGLRELAAALQKAIGASYISEPDIVRPAPDTLAAGRTTTAASDAADAADATATTATAAVAAAAGAVVASAAGSSSGRTTQPLTPPPSWDDLGAGGGGDGWGRGAAFDDAAAELGEGELERFSQQCQDLGLMDEQGNFTGARLAEAEAEGRTDAGPRMFHDALDEQDQSFLDEHQPGRGAGAANGDGADGDDEWVDLASLDEETLAAVLAELELAEAAGELRGEGAGGEAAGSRLDLARDFRIAPEEEATSSGMGVGPAGGSEAGGREAVAALTAGQRVGGGPERVAGGEAAVGEEGAAAAEEEEEGLVRMAPPDDPDARLVGLSLEELLALEKDW